MPPVKILIIEDEKTLQSAMYTALHKSKYDPIICTDGQQGIDAINKEKFAIILLDLILPIKDGYEVLEAKKTSLNKDTPVIVVTNLNQEEDLTKARMLGATECYKKADVSLKVVIKTIQKIIKKQESQ